MAWVSVHEQVKDHPKTRELARLLQCNRHEAIGVLTTLWLWAINNADRDGYILNASADDIADGIMYRGQSAGHLLECLISSGWIDVSNEGGQFILHDWDVWQEQWYKALDRRVSEKNRKREQRNKAGQSAGQITGQSAGQSAGTAQHNRNRNRNHTVTIQEPHVTTEDNSHPSSADAKEILPVGFVEFWDAYPRKVKKQDALKAWSQVKASENIDDIMSRLGLFVSSPEWQKDGGQYIPYPASWLRARRWEDEQLPGVHGRNVLEEIFQEETERVNYDASRHDTDNRTIAEGLPAFH